MTDEPRWLGNTLSLFALAVAAAGLAALVWMRRLFATSPILIGVQVAAVMLMLWARMTFGARSFHAAASTSEGGLVTNGPYRFLRHPIYASIIYFVWAGQVQAPTGQSLAAAALVTAGLAARMLLEERFLRTAYPDYAEYARRTKRVIPFIV